MLVPAYLSIISVLILALRALISSKWFTKLWSRLRRSDKTSGRVFDAEVDADEPVIRTHAGIIADIQSHVKAKGGPIIFFWKLLRLAGCLTLVGLTMATLIIDEEGRESTLIDVLKKKKKKGKKKTDPISDEFTLEEWLHVALCLTYVCT